MKKYLKATTQKARSVTKAQAVSTADSLFFTIKTAILMPFMFQKTFLKGYALKM